MQPLSTAALLCLALAGCSHRPRGSVTNGSSVTLAPPVTLVATPPAELVVTRTPCPFASKLKSPAGCAATALPAPPGTRALQRLSCGPVGTTTLVEDVGQVALRARVSIVEGNTSFVVMGLQLPSGERLPVPDEVLEPFLLGGAVAGAVYVKEQQRLGLWVADVCETLDAPVSQLRTTTTGEVVGLRGDDQHQDLVLRRANGTWVSLGRLPFRSGVRPLVNGAAVTLATTDTNGRGGLLARALFPDLERAEVVRRFEHFEPRHSNGGVSAVPQPWGPSRLSWPVMSDLDSTNSRIEIGRASCRERVS
jgi:hypothetical protein